MNSVELREKRAKLWEGTKAFLDSHRMENGLLSAEDDAAYDRMETEIVALGKEIERAERAEAMDRELAKAVNTPIVDKPSNAPKIEKGGRANDEYSRSFWNVMRAKTPNYEFVNALQEGENGEGGFLVPDEFERTLVQALEEENIFRKIAKIIRTDSGTRAIPVVSGHGSAAWLDEEKPFVDSDETFGQVTLGAHKVGTTIKISDELMQDSAFDLEGYMASEFARRIGAKEEEAFFTGDGVGKPLGILAASGGADVGKVTAAATSIKADEIIDLFHSLRPAYRKNAIWMMNDTTISELRKLKDSNGQYLWQTSLAAGTPDTLLGLPVMTSAYMPEIKAGNKTIAFGDFKYYWIADRLGRTFKRLNELYATSGQVGFIGQQRVDGKLILPEAIKVLSQKASA